MNEYLVLLNTCVLALEHHNQPEWLDDFQVPTLPHFYYKKLCI